MQLTDHSSIFFPISFNNKILIFSLVWWQWIPLWWSPKRLLDKNCIIFSAFCHLWCCLRLFSVIVWELYMCEKHKHFYLFVRASAQIDAAHKECFQKQPNLILFLFKAGGLLIRKRVRPVPFYHSCSPQLKSWDCCSLWNTLHLLTLACRRICEANKRSNSLQCYQCLFLTWTDFFSAFPVLNFKAVSGWEWLSQTRALYLSLLFSAATSRPRASLLSVASSSSLCSFLRFALIRWDSSSASSSCLFSCFSRVLPFSA